MRTDRVVGPPPALDEHLRFEQCVEDFAIKELVAQLAVETLNIAILVSCYCLLIEGIPAVFQKPSA
jgi:hypothetical protein